MTTSTAPLPKCYTTKPAAAPLPECCDPSAPVVPCCVCDRPVHTCEAGNASSEGNHVCPAHPDGVERESGAWVCSERCDDVAAAIDLLRREGFADDADVVSGFIATLTTHIAAQAEEIAALTEARDALADAGAQKVKALEALTSRVAELEDLLEWRVQDDRDDEHTASIDAAHPCNTGGHGTYVAALKMVGNRYSKYGLVDLVNWLLARAEAAEAKCAALEAARAQDRERIEALEWLVEVQNYFHWFHSWIDPQWCSKVDEDACKELCESYYAARAAAGV